MEAKPQKTTLHLLVGDWTFESECLMGPDRPPWGEDGKWLRFMTAHYRKK